MHVHERCDFPVSLHRYILATYYKYRFGKSNLYGSNKIGTFETLRTIVENPLVLYPVFCTNHVILFNKNVFCLTWRDNFDGVYFSLKIENKKMGKHFWRKFWKVVRKNGNDKNVRFILETNMVNYYMDRKKQKKMGKIITISDFKK